MGATLRDRQWELDERFLFGLGTGIMVDNFSFGEVELDFEDRKNANADGESTGPESYGGRTITFDIQLYTGDAADHGNEESVFSDKLAERLTAAWRRCRGRTVVLRYRLFGRTRRVYGSCRKLSPPPDGFDLRHGVGKFTAEFRCRDGFTYSDELETVELRTTPNDGTGFSSEFGGEFQMQGENPPIPGLITVGGEFPVAISAKIDGPISTPIIDVADLWKAQIDYDLVEGRSIEFDTTQWNRGIRLDGRINLAGKLSRMSPKPSGCLIPPGRWSVTLRGKSSTGSAMCSLSWRQCFSNY